MKTLNLTASPHHANHIQRQPQHRAHAVANSTAARALSAQRIRMGKRHPNHRRRALSPARLAAKRRTACRSRRGSLACLAAAAASQRRNHHARHVGTRLCRCRRLSPAKQPTAVATNHRVLRRSTAVARMGAPFGRRTTYFVKQHAKGSLKTLFASHKRANSLSGCLQTPSCTIPYSAASSIFGFPLPPYCWAWAISRKFVTTPKKKPKQG